MTRTATTVVLVRGRPSGGKRFRYETAQKWPYDEKTGAFQAPPASGLGNKRGNACVPLPPAELLLTQYKQADEVLTTPDPVGLCDPSRRRYAPDGA